MNHAIARRHMVDCQIATNRICDPGILAAMAAVPREMFVPKTARNHAYADRDLPLGNGRYSPSPLILAQLMMAARLQPADVVLVLGDGSGYVAAVLSKLVQTVVSVECDAELCAKASKSLEDLGIDNAVVVTGPLAAGYPAQAPYDVILLAGSVPAIPLIMGRQLADAGRLVAVEQGAKPGCLGRGKVLVRVGDTFGQRVAFDGLLPPLPGFAIPGGFRF